MKAVNPIDTTAQRVAAALEAQPPLALLGCLGTAGELVLPLWGAGRWSLDPALAPRRRALGFYTHAA